MRMPGSVPPSEDAETAKSLLPLRAPSSPRDAEGFAVGQTQEWRCGKMCAFIVVQVAVFVASLWWYTAHSDSLRHREALRVAELEEEVRRATERNARLRSRAEQMRGPAASGSDASPFEAITGFEDGSEPEMYGRVREKTIWTYWYHKDDCPERASCTMPAHLQLCLETMEKNRGGFDLRLVHRDEVSQYVSWYELPFRWTDLEPAQQKDSLMNALLARYGGVAVDVSTILLRPLDEYWDEMVEQKAAYWGYMYRVNGMPWRHAEVSVVWFMMARREGVFANAVRSQVMGMGDSNNTGAYHHWYLALGDQTLTPILANLNYSLPKCFDDDTVQDTGKCPEYEMPRWHEGLVGPSRNDMRAMLRDPRDGPQLPFAWKGMLTWRVSNNTEGLDLSDNEKGSPLYLNTCKSMSSCWRDVFLRRFAQPAEPGRGRLLNMVKLFKHGFELDGKTREEILADKDTFFYNWLNLAGLV